MSQVAPARLEQRKGRIQRIGHQRGPSGLDYDYVGSAEALYDTERIRNTHRRRDQKIITDISWAEDEDHSPSVEFRAEVAADAGYPIFVRGSYNAAALTLTYALIHRGSGRICALDLGKDHHNPARQSMKKGKDS